MPAGTRVCPACGERPPVVVDRRAWPILVRLGLAMIHSRAAAWNWFWLSASLGLLFLFFGVALAFYHLFFFGAGVLAAIAMGLAALWYYLSIRWVDRHDDWSKP